MSDRSNRVGFAWAGTGLLLLTLALLVLVGGFVPIVTCPYCEGRKEFDPKEKQFLPCPLCHGKQRVPLGVRLIYNPNR